VIAPAFVLLALGATHATWQQRGASAGVARLMTASVAQSFVTAGLAHVSYRVIAPVSVLLALGATHAAWQQSGALAG
jgi:hypothetical protein